LNTILCAEYVYDALAECDYFVFVVLLFSALLNILDSYLGLEILLDNLSCNLMHQKCLGYLIKELKIIVNHDKSFCHFLMALTFVLEFAYHHHTLMVIHGISSRVL
jgi:hypothetical protein